jgi:hypothetical protein
VLIAKPLIFAGMTEDHLSIASGAEVVAVRVRGGHGERTGGTALGDAATK